MRSRRASGKTLRSNGLRAHVAQVHPEAYARSCSVRAHQQTRQRMAFARKRRRAPEGRQGGAYLEVRKRTPLRGASEALPAQGRAPSGNWRRGDQENV